MKNILILTLASTTLILTTCKKNNDKSSPNIGTVLPTEVGTILEDATFKTIGPSGGTIISTDGKLDLEFPQGALSSNTNISVQAVTNKAPGAIGNAYRFGPAGTLVNMPVTMIMHYTSDNVAGSLPMFLGIAFQDTDQKWYDLRKYTVDTINKTISVLTTKLFASSSSNSAPSPPPVAQ